MAYMAPIERLLTDGDLERMGVVKRQTLAKWRMQGRGPRYHKLPGSGTGEYTFRWSKFDNDTEQQTPLSGETSATLPLALNESPAGAYFAVGIAAGDEHKTVTVYLRKNADHVQVVGIDR